MSVDPIHAYEIQLAEMDRIGLRKAWAQVFDTAASNHLSLRFMRRALLWEKQCRLYGGLSAELKRALAAAASGAQVRVPQAQIKPDSQLVREWNGRHYQVEVLENGYRLDGREYASLSAVARHITGTHWSGPRFFGIAPRKGAA